MVTIILILQMFFPTKSILLGKKLLITKLGCVI